MSDFTVNKILHDDAGRVMYECTCSECGSLCYYRRKMKTKPLCIPCSYKLDQAKKKRRAESRIDAAVDRAVKKCADAVSVCIKCVDCPIDCKWGTEESCKENWLLYLKDKVEN